MVNEENPAIFQLYALDMPEKLLGVAGYMPRNAEARQVKCRGNVGDMPGIFRGYVRDMLGI